MITIALTGGIACGKSTIASLFVEQCRKDEVAKFDCDQGVALLYEDPDVIKQVGELDYDLVKDSRLDRKLLRERAFESSEFREKLERILHPLVLKQIREFVLDVSEGTKILLVEVPLLYEVEFAIERDLDLVVASSRETQLQRLSENRNIDRELATRIIESQMPLEEKMKRADIVIWNDGSEESAWSQVDHLMKRCRPIFDV